LIQYRIYEQAVEVYGKTGNYVIYRKENDIMFDQYYEGFASNQI
jgi:hypothetical protein